MKRSLYEFLKDLYNKGVELRSGCVFVTIHPTRPDQEAFELIIPDAETLLVKKKTKIEYEIGERNMVTIHGRGWTHFVTAHTSKDYILEESK